MTKIAVLVNIPKCKGIKFTNWHDGFTKACELLNNYYKLDIINISIGIPANFDDYDIILFKESFDCYIYRRCISRVKDKILGLLISSSHKRPTDSELKMYHILFYETYWYYNYAKLDRHPHAFHAFGVDTSVMRPVNLEKKYDVLFVGDITEHKRPLKILEKTGKKLCVGFKSKPELCQQLELGGVEIMDFIKYEELAILYNSSKSCFIPCVTHGGGERAVLEARSCGIPVEICSDNPKLAELMSSQIYNSEYYAKQLYNGIHEYLCKL